MTDEYVRVFIAKGGTTSLYLSLALKNPACTGLEN
jgi:hypothetical protein